MLNFSLALIVFLLFHFIPTQKAVREFLIGYLGKSYYLKLYSFLSIILIIWVFWAAHAAPYIPLWLSSTWQAMLAFLLVPIGLFFASCGMIIANPLSISILEVQTDRPFPGVLSITRHPIPWGLALWSGGHVAVNGDLVRFILFGGFSLLAIIGTLAIDRRQMHMMNEEQWQKLAKETSNIPFLAIIKRHTTLSWDSNLAFGLLITTFICFCLLAGGHEWLFGVDPLAWWL